MALRGICTSSIEYGSSEQLRLAICDAYALLYVLSSRIQCLRNGFSQLLKDTLYAVTYAQTDLFTITETSIALLCRVWMNAKIHVLAESSKKRGLFLEHIFGSLSSSPFPSFTDMSNRALRTVCSHTCF